ncbi:MAG: hypothetical protein ACYC7E_11470 [Armatimonadota bacterium]
MFDWFHKKQESQREPSPREAILNTGLDLAMEWGEYWLKPIQQRLQKLYPELTPEELDEYNAICRTAMNYGHDTVESMFRELGEATSQVEWEKVFLARYPWANAPNLRRLYNQGRYYALK